MLSYCTMVDTPISSIKKKLRSERVKICPNHLFSLFGPLMQHDLIYQTICSLFYTRCQPMKSSSFFVFLGQPKIERYGGKLQMRVAYRVALFRDKSN